MVICIKFGRETNDCGLFGVFLGGHFSTQSQRMMDITH